MNCPNCGAENEVGARFCVECGAPLENQVELPDHPPEFFDDDSDRTILSTASRVAEEAKTMAVTQEQLAEAESAASYSAEPESSFLPPPPSAGAGSGGSSGFQGLMTQRNIIIAVVVILLLCCCCCALGVAINAASNPEAIEDILDELSLLPLYIPLV